MDESYSPPRLSGFFILLLSFVIFLSSIMLLLLNQTPARNLTSAWKTYYDKSLSFQYPASWKENSRQPTGSGFFQSITDPDNFYELEVYFRGNYNNGTGKPFSSLQEYTGMPYPGKILSVGGKEAMQYLPRAGSENVSSVNFFSGDRSGIYTLTLATGKSPQKVTEAEIISGQKLFSQILSTFKFIESIPTPTPLSGWTTYQSPTSGFRLKLPASWKILQDDSYQLIISNLDFNPYVSNGSTPITGQIIVTIGLTSASLENYSPKKIAYTTTEGVPVFKQGRHLDSSGSVGVITLYIQNDPQTSRFEKTVSEILSVNKFTN